MRTIKFRAVLNKEARTNKTYEDWKKLIYFTLQDLMRGKVTFVHPEHWQFDEYTGLLDKNGKEIYEGDVVRAWEPETETTTGELRMIIDDALNCYAPLRDMLIDKKDVEVIGKIYQNPELKK